MPIPKEVLAYNASQSSPTDKRQVAPDPVPPDAALSIRCSR